MLSGIRIVEIEGLGPGPFAGMLLADLGAEVIVLHRKGGGSDITGGASVLDRGKRSIVLDLKDGDDLATAKALIARADGLIEGFRPGVMERLGLGPDVCHALNPALAYGRMTGWGQDGSRHKTAGHDLNYIATSGALYYASAPEAAPITPATLVGDIGGGALYLVVGMLAAILKARETGKGAVVDAAIVDGSAHMMNLLMALGQGGGLSEERGQSLLDGPHWSRTYACADGGYLSVQCLEPKFYGIFLEVLGLSGDAVFAPQYERALWPDQTAALAAIFVAKPVRHWADLFAGSDACVAPVLSPQMAKNDLHMAARGVWQIKDGALQAAPAPRFESGARAVSTPPVRGQHSVEIRDEIRAEIGKAEL
ncbi:MAG: CaiB/BaiF CoA-transferase family protein [Rhodobacterales bacterium]|nr:CaiB/BaiF CoA-transferase family protein [Rhodobacterales bacterium]